MQRRKPLSSVLIKPAGPDCNLACHYCFYLDKSEMFVPNKEHRMDIPILEETIRQVLSQASQAVSFIWQGGEPTLMGIDFYRQAIDFQKQYENGQTIGNSFQTNGLLINKEWADFLYQYKFLVGLSLDGPEHIHDRYRYLKGGQSSWNRISDSARRLLGSEVAVNALTVVNDYSVKFPKEIYEFNKQLGLTYMQFIPCVETDANDPTRAAPYSAPPEKYGEFLCVLFDLWWDDFVDGVPTVYVRYFEDLFYHYVGLNPPECTLLSTCGNYVVVEHNGDVFSCDFFVESQWKLGNVMDGRIIDMLNSDQQTQFGRMKSNLPALCIDCEWLSKCGGGCTKDRMRDPQDKALNHFCRSYKMFFKHADGRLKQLAATWKWQQEEILNQQVIYYRGQSPEVKVGRNDLCVCGSGKKFKKCCALVS